MDFTQNKKILFISNAKYDFGRIGEKVYDAFRENGYDIDYLTVYPVEDRRDIKYIYPRENWFYKYTTNLTWKIISRIKRRIPKYCFFNYSDTQQPVSAKKIIKVTKNKHYDIIMVFFWQYFVTSVTLSQLYRKYDCKMFFLMADFVALSGGCHYYVDCDRYTSGCGNCPGWLSTDPFDVTYKNTLLRKNLYDEIRPIILGNSYMQQIYKNSVLLKDRTYIKSLGIVDLKHFSPRNIDEARLRYNIPKEKTTLLFFGCQSLTDPKKGMRELLRALNVYSHKLNDGEKAKVLLLIAGRKIEHILPEIPFDYKYLGFVSYNELPVLYSMATCYLSPSINDAGPSMVNQALACGTPVVSFNIGVAQDCVVNGFTGYKAKVGDESDLAEGIYTICNLSVEEIESMRTNCREMAQKHFSTDSFVRSVQAYFTETTGQQQMTIQ